MISLIYRERSKNQSNIAVKIEPVVPPKTIKKSSKKPVGKSNEKLPKNPLAKDQPKPSTIPSAPQKENLLEIEHQMAALNMEIKSSLSEEKADTCVALIKLTEMKKIAPQTTKMMLAKNPNTVETIKKLKRYIGNATNWTLADNQKFLEDATEIRDLADEIYDDFKNVFSYTGNDDQFWNEFIKIVEKTRRLNEEDFKNLCFEEELSKLKGTRVYRKKGKQGSKGAQVKTKSST